MDESQARNLPTFIVQNNNTSSHLGYHLLFRIKQKSNINKFINHPLIQNINQITKRWRNYLVEYDFADFKEQPIFSSRLSTHLMEWGEENPRRTLNRRTN